MTRKKKEPPAKPEWARTSGAKRIGRPVKPVQEGTRVSLGLKVRPEVKARIDTAARNSGRTQSQEAEHLIEMALAPITMLERMQQTFTEIERGNVEATFRRLGYMPLRTPHGTAWLPPGHPGLRSGFIAPEEDK
ncbi:hypothetical protein XI06_14195 [Bradyrhizobium sp. CCBAU 11434]|uniref:hypothetical protein n=1 Tax=Bradyrhizobium sp. CCBAU 11434 TaxID=1630885 RepID=UPI002305B36A|nr:hypothetical protein [Bradyrhizobium sp. CCBAU 11434]MDA9521470.1 hypothetical protein [Bradyrhizobium sp. CCBAU 11434]